MLIQQVLKPVSTPCWVWNVETSVECWNHVKTMVKAASYYLKETFSYVGVCAKEQEASSTNKSMLTRIFYVKSYLLRCCVYVHYLFLALDPSWRVPTSTVRVGLWGRRFCRQSLSPVASCCLSSSPVSEDCVPESLIVQFCFPLSHIVPCCLPISPWIFILSGCLIFSGQIVGCRLFFYQASACSIW